MNPSQEFLEEMYKEQGDFFIHYIKLNIPQWKAWVLYSTATEEQKEEANLRQLAPCELLLDIESPDDLAKTVKDVRQDFKTFTVWETGSRGFHISIFIPKLKELPVEKREQLRLHYIKKYGCDETKKSDKTLVALEYAPHFKTGNPKTMKGGRAEGVNILPYPDLPESCTPVIAPAASKSISAPDVQNDPVLAYVLKNQIPDGTKRNSCLFKNLAILLVQSDLTEEQKDNYIETIVGNCPGKHKAEFLGWVKKARTGKIAEYNKNEMNIWIDSNLLPINKYQETIEEPKTIFSLAELMKSDLAPVDYYIEPIIPKNNVIIIGGKPGSFKSFFMLLMGISMVNSEYLLGKFKVTNNYKILLYDLENGPRVIYQRTKYTMNGLGITDYNALHGLLIEPNFDRNDIEKEFNKAKDFDIIILDSYRRFLKGDESDSQITDMFYKNFLKPLKALGKTIIILHHFRKSRPEDMDDADFQDMFRGSSDLVGQVDLAYGLIKSPEIISADCNTMKFDVSIVKAKNREGLPIRNFTISVLKDDLSQKTIFEFKKFGIIDPNEGIKTHIRQLLEKGGMKRLEIVEAVRTMYQVCDKTIDNILKQMAKEGEIKKVATGQYITGREMKEATAIIQKEMAEAAAVLLGEIEQQKANPKKHKIKTKKEAKKAVPGKPYKVYNVTKSTKKTKEK